jgi:hypothetical protein
VDKNIADIFFSIEPSINDNSDSEEIVESNKRKHEDIDDFWQSLISLNLEYSEREVNKRRKLRENVESQIIPMVEITDGPVPTAHSIHDIDRSIARHVYFWILSAV